LSSGSGEAPAVTPVARAWAGGGGGALPPRPASSVGGATPVVFKDDAGSFFKMVLRGGGLQLVTFGFYRFWLTTDIRRHLWSRTSVAGEPLEYLGRAKELLIGFLVALAILTPLYIAYAAAGFIAESVQAFASLPFFLILYLLGQFAYYRARRYRLTRTVWRGVRFWMEGSGWAYAGRAALWGLLSIVTLYLAAPWRAASLERYKMRNTRYGDQQGDFVGTGGGFFKRVWWIYLTVVAFVMLYGVIAAKSAGGGRGNGLLALLMFIGLIGTLFLVPTYRALEWRWWAEGARLGAARFECALSGGDLLKCYFKYFASVFVLIVVAVILVVLIVAGFGPVSSVAGLGNAMSRVGVAPLIAIVAVYLLTFVAVGALSRYFLTHHVWRAVAQSMSVIGVENLENARQSAQASSSVAEGLADQLDVGAF
jgi:uncharacterized membrane protein YjgN (DUF898 family)